jgi:hypothetical protein
MLDQPFFVNQRMKCGRAQSLPKNHGAPGLSGGFIIAERRAGSGGNSAGSAGILPACSLSRFQAVSSLFPAEALPHAWLP